jgi:hypothetical protein
MGNCHCRDCQRSSGGAYAPMLGVPSHAVKITGAVTWYESRAGSGSIASRGFCPSCGARLFAKSSADPSIIEVHAGSLDDPSCFKPAEDIFTSSAQPWDSMNPALRKFPRQPKN